MNKLRFYGYLAAGTLGLVLLFALNFCYLFAALGIFAFGMIALPSTLLGAAGFIHITADMPLPALAITSAGALLLGAGMCLGAAAVCPASMGRLRRFCKSLEWRRRRLDDE